METRKRQLAFRTKIHDHFRPVCHALYLDADTYSAICEAVEEFVKTLDTTDKKSYNGSDARENATD